MERKRARPASPEQRSALAAVGTRPAAARFDAVGALENAYSLDRSAAEWLEGVTHSLAPFLDHGLGVDGYGIELVPRPAISGRASYASTTPTLTIEGIFSELDEANQARLLAHFLRPHSFGLIDHFGAAVVTHMSAALRFHPQARDVWTWVLPVPGGRAYLFCAPLRAPFALTPANERRVARIGAHILAAARLRHATDAPEAVLEPDGRVVHAEGEARSNVARERLRASARAVDRARSKLRHRDPDEAVGLWHGLVDGQWSLVDRFDSDGRRFVVARRNEPPVQQLRALTKRESVVVAHAAEGMQLKAVAYTLGLPLATVATVLERALSKLGIGTRAELGALAEAIARAERSTR